MVKDMSETAKDIDTLSAQARKEAAKLNQTLDELKDLGVEATVCRISTLFGNTIPIDRVQFVLIDLPHKKKK